MKEALSGWAVDAECCYTSEGERKEDARQLDNRTSEIELRLSTKGTKQRGQGAVDAKGLRRRPNIPEGTYGILRMVALTK